MDEELATVQISVTYREVLRRLAQENRRSMKSEFECILDAEIARRGNRDEIVVSAPQGGATREIQTPNKPTK